MKRKKTKKFLVLETDFTTSQSVSLACKKYWIQTLEYTTED